MVRAHVKQSDEEKKETRKKKTPAKSKKSSEAGVWPCKINGCNKQFAREADLKRHQRTTKSHSMPGFACPQCDATFTRTDALRRHQKSRHNGVIIEPIETQKNQDDEDNNEAGSSASKPGSRSASPTAKGKGKGKAKKNDPPTALANPGTAGPGSGPTSYYRQHTMQNVFFSPPQGMMMEAQQYTQNGLGLPTSATRLHQASWPPPPPWAADGGPQPQMGTISYHPGQQPGFYQPSPYYRQNGPMNGSSVMQQQFVSQPQDMQNGMSPHQNAAPTQENHPSGSATPSMQNNPNSNQQGTDVALEDNSNLQGTAEGQSVPAAPVIDPSLDMSSTISAVQAGNAQGGSAGGGTQAGQASTSKPVSLEITQAAMEAVLQSAQRESSRPSGTPDQGVLPANGHVNAQASIAGGSQQQVGSGAQGGTGAVTNPNSGGDLTQLSIPAPTTTTAKSPFAHQSPILQPQPLPQPGARPEPMEPMLTEDGEPMLNPAELLTQESLASPPP
jgi:hypothetical protein